MRYSVAMKFLAILLCAATLLCAVGSAVGMVAMAEQGLYDRSVEEAYEEYLEGVAGSYANAAAAVYASGTLGGADSQLIDERLGYRNWYYGYFDPDRVGYVLRDGEGTVLDSQELEGYSARYTFTVPAKLFGREENNIYSHIFA